jgi:hypothetical protein
MKLNDVKILSTFWDDEILDKKTSEIKILADKDFIEIDSLFNLDSEYIVLKINPKFQRYYLNFVSKTFYQIESQIEIVYENVELFDIHNFFSKSKLEEFQFNQVSANKISLITDIISNNLPFTTDRISLDPYFSHELANKRYIRWINTMVKGDAMAFELALNDKPIGFSMIKQIDNKNVDLILTAIYDTSKSTGFGLLLLALTLNLLTGRGYKNVYTRNSSNNVNSLKTHLYLGFKITDVINVFVMHKKIGITNGK